MAMRSRLLVCVLRAGRTFNGDKRILTPKCKVLLLQKWRKRSFQLLPCDCVCMCNFPDRCHCQLDLLSVHVSPFCHALTLLRTQAHDMHTHITQKQNSINQRVPLAHSLPVLVLGHSTRTRSVWRSLTFIKYI